MESSHIIARQDVYEMNRLIQEQASIAKNMILAKIIFLHPKLTPEEKGNLLQHMADTNEEEKPFYQSLIFENNRNKQSHATSKRKDQ